MSQDAALWRAWHDAAQRPDITQRLRVMLDEIDQQVSGSGFACRQSGRCCKFESFGHRLYMTGLEIAWFRALAGEPLRPATDGSVSLPVFDSKQDGCPYQVNGGCSVHPLRPFACRVFFCQEGSDAWQTEQYEDFQQKIKRLHEELELPYRYMEWREGLAAADEHGY